MFWSVLAEQWEQFEVDLKLLFENKSPSTAYMPNIMPHRAGYTVHGHINTG